MKFKCKKCNAPLEEVTSIFTGGDEVKTILICPDCEIVYQAYGSISWEEPELIEFSQN